MAVNPQIVDYIKQNSTSFSKEVLIKTLTEAGWPALDVFAAFTEIEHPAAVTVPTAAQPVAVRAEPLDQGADFVAEMARRRSEAAAALPSQNNITVGTSHTPMYAQRTVVEEKGLIGMLIRMKVVQNTQQANIVLVCVAVACIGLSAWFVWPSTAAPVPHAIPPAMLTPTAPR